MTFSFLGYRVTIVDIAKWNAKITATDKARHDSCPDCHGKRTVKTRRAFSSPVFYPYGYTQETKRQPAGAVLVKSATENNKYDQYEWDTRCTNYLHL
jgi:hypothetical protein